MKKIKKLERGFEYMGKCENTGIDVYAKKNIKEFLGGGIVGISLLE